MATAGKLLAFAGLGLLVLGGLFYALARLGIARLPGDVVFRRGHLTVYAPLGLMLLVSVVLTIVLNVFLRR